MEHDSIEAPLSSASFLLQRSDRFLSRLRIFEQKLGRISRLTRKTISRKGSVEYPVLLADAEVYWMEFEVAWKTYFEEYDVLMRDAKHLIGSGYIDSSQAMMIEDAVEACSHRVSTCQSLMGKTMRLIGSVRRIASSKGVQHNPVVDLLRDFRLRAFSPKRPRPNRRRELRPPPTPATSSRTLVKQQLRKLHEHEREETRASGGNHHTRHGKWVVRDADLVEGDDESPRKSTSVRRMRRDRGRIRSEDEANEAYDTCMDIIHIYSHSFADAFQGQLHQMCLVFFHENSHRRCAFSMFPSQIVLSIEKLEDMQWALKLLIVTSVSPIVIVCMGYNMEGSDK
eukprot:TRINITY_DN565_c0_g4_i2.p1 TRINITY_DN565_c0_g4~~TRINITY_DN565_c0_g4_i2.p1  ORF type:complete len:375 (-),score=84.52 TRINITY_DN565_c0_g4_i2:646-1665(-)